jgi:N-acetylneuraminic acid mutarotase
MKWRGACFLVLALFLGMPAAASELSQVPAQSILWSRGPDIPLPRGGYYASWYQGGLLIAGGTYWKDSRKTWTDQVSYYDPVRNIWRNWPPLPIPLAYGVIGQVGGRLYIIGGMNEDKLVLDIFRLDGQKWSRIGVAPVGSIYGGSAVVGHKIYVLGGGTSNTDYTTATRQAWAFNPISLTWEELEPFPGKPRIVHAVASHEDSIFLFGGATQSSEQTLIDLKDAYRFDTVKRKWSTLKPMFEPCRALWATSVSGSIYLFGGLGERGLDTVYRYDPKRDEYYLVSRLPAPLFDSKFFFHKGLFYGATGEDKPRSRFPGLYIGRSTLR